VINGSDFCDLAQFTTETHTVQGSPIAMTGQEGDFDLQTIRATLRLAPNVN